MRMFGVEETRCHNMDVSKVKQKTRKTKAFPCKCTGCGDTFTVGTVRRNKILKGAKYQHVCGGGRRGFVELTSHMPV
jgi:predicted SprT family Zn-dependent metalloprotease